MISRAIAIYPILALLLVLPQRSLGQREWTLEECIQAALDQNIGIKRQALQIDQARNNLQTAIAGKLPGVTGFISHNLSSGKTVNFEDYTYINTQYQDGNLGIQATLPLSQGLRNWSSAREARYNLLSQVEKEAELKNTLVIQVTAAYLQVLFAEELQAIADSNLAVIREQVRKNEGFYQTGRIAKTEVLSMKAQEAQQNFNGIQAKSETETAYLNLAQLMNLKDFNGFRIRKPEILNLAGSEIQDPATIIEYALDNQPGIHSAEHALRSRESGLSAARSDLYPSVDLNGLLYSRYSELAANQLNPGTAYPYSEQLMDNMYKRVALNVNIPVFARLQNRNRISTARILANDAQLLLEEKRNALRQEILQAYYLMKNASSKLVAAGESVKSATESFNLIKEKYNAGLSSSIEFKVAQNQLLQAHSTQVQAKYEYLLRSKILDFYLDKPVKLD